MGLTELPKELFQAVLYHAIEVRGFKRGLRLRLVSRRWAAEVGDTVYAYRMLDDRFLNGEVPPPFAASYLEYRIHNGGRETGKYPMMGWLRRIARELVAENESLRYEGCVRLLCRLIAEGGASTALRLYIDLASTRSEDRYIDALFVAAVVTNTVSIVQRYVGNYKKSQFPTTLIADSDNFFRLAARFANDETLGLILSGGWADVVHDARRVFVLLGAAYTGSFAAFRFAHEFRMDESPWDYRDRKRHLVIKAAFNEFVKTPSKDVWDVVVEWKKKYGFVKAMSEGHRTRVIELCVAEGGDASLLEHLLDEGGSDFDYEDDPSKLTGLMMCACAQGYEDLVRVLLSKRALPESAVAVAAAYGHTSIVHVLLEQGATPSGGLLQAARGGYMDIVQVLLDVGVPADESKIPLITFHGSDRILGIGAIREKIRPREKKLGATKVPIAAAIAMEHVAMAEMLKANGAKLDGHAGAECLEVAREEGLESMLDLLYEWGVH